LRDGIEPVCGAHSSSETRYERDRLASREGALVELAPEVFDSSSLGGPAVNVVER
jgi:hypothetical protein